MKRKSEVLAQSETLVAVLHVANADGSPGRVVATSMPARAQVTSTGGVGYYLRALFGTADIGWTMGCNVTADGSKQWQS